MFCYGVHEGITTLVKTIAAKMKSGYYSDAHTCRTSINCVQRMLVKRCKLIIWCKSTRMFLELKLTLPIDVIRREIATV